VRDFASQVFRRTLERSPRLYSAFDQWRGNTSFTPLRANTALVISGYASSGNTYLRQATLAANPGLEIASHAHNSTEVALAVRRGLPTVFLAREPLQTVASVMVRYSPDFIDTSAFEEYARLYERSLRLRSGFLVATFAETTGDTGGIIERVNTRFDVSLLPFDDHDARAVQAVTDAMRAYDARVLGSQAPLTGSAPSGQRDSRKAAVIEELSRPKYAHLIDRCRAAYDAMVGSVSMGR
jgi:hypothetical protein